MIPVFYQGKGNTGNLPGITFPKIRYRVIGESYLLPNPPADELVQGFPSPSRTMRTTIANDADEMISVLVAAVDTLWLDNDRLNHDIRLLRSQMAALRTDNERYVVQDARYQSVLLNFRSDSDNEEDYEDATIDALFAAQDTRVRAEWIAPAPLPGG